MTRPRSRWVLLTVLVTGAMMLSACGNGAGASGDAQVRKAGTVDINAQPVGSLKDGGNLNLALSQWQVQWNYNQVQGAAVDAVLVLRTLLPEPFLQNQDGTVRPNANLLDSAQLISSDPEVIELKMKKKARWSDGTPITYQDWVADWKAGNGSNPNYQSAHTTGWNSIDSIDRGVDDQDVKINFRTPFAEWKGLLNFLYPASMYATADQFNNGWVNKIPVTAGPFKVKNIDQTDKTLTVERDPNWWGARPKLDTITFKVVDTNSLAQAFQGDAIDAVDIATSVPTYQTLVADQGATIHKALAPNWRVVDFGARPDSPTADPRVRVALMKGIDRAELARAVIGPIVPDAHPLNNHLYVEGQAHYQDNSGPYAYDKAGAAKQLDAAGWKLPSGKQVREKNGKPLELQFVIPTEVTTSAGEAQQIQNQLGQIGVKVDINAVDHNSWTTQYVTVGNFDLLNLTWEGVPFPISSATGIYSYYPNNQQQNSGRIPDTEGINQLFGQANAELDDTKRSALANQIDQKIWVEGFSLPLYQAPDAWATKKNLANFGAFGFAEPDWTQVGWMK